VRKIYLMTVTFFLIFALTGISVQAETFYSDDFSDPNKLNNYKSTEGKQWVIENGILKPVGNITDNLSFGDDNWKDYTIEFDFTAKNGAYDGGLIVRQSAQSYDIGIRSISWPASGSGNFLEIYKEGVSVADSNAYVRQSLELKDNTTYKIKVVVKDSTIRVFVSNVLYINYTDSDTAYAPKGKLAFKSFESGIEYDNLTVRSVTEEDLADTGSADINDNTGERTVNTKYTITEKSGGNVKTDEKALNGTDKKVMTVICIMGFLSIGCLIFLYSLLVKKVNQGKNGKASVSHEE